MQRFALFALVAGLACAEPMDAIFARMDANAKASNSFAADVKIQKFTKILNKTYEESGTIKLRRQKNSTIGRMDVEKPDQYTWHFAGDNFEKYLPKVKEVQVIQASKFLKNADRYLLLGFGSTSADLKKTFDVKQGPEETIAGMKATRLDLVPKDKKAAEAAAKVELWIPAGQSYAIQQRITEPNGNYTQYTYTDAKLNPNLPESAFVFQPPAGTKRTIIK